MADVADHLQARRRSRTLADKAYERILALIVAEKLEVGDKLPTERDLCEQLGVSRPVLRRALENLRGDGVIVSQQGSGSFVNSRPDEATLKFAPAGSIADIQRVFEFRGAIEGEAASLAAQRQTPADLVDMTRALKQLDRCIDTQALGVTEDDDFHQAICIAGDNQYLLMARNSMKSNIQTGMNLTRNLSLTHPIERLRLVQNEHYEILRAIEARDARSARDAMRAHIDNARRRVFEGR
jgi:DNA-binding FadR family transcriptional regulator